MESLTSGNYQEWQFGFQAEIPIGFRKEHAGVRNAQLTVAKQKTLLREMELEVSHQVAAALRQVDLNNTLINTNFKPAKCGQTRRRSRSGRLRRRHADDQRPVGPATPTRRGRSGILSCDC